MWGKEAVVEVVYFGGPRAAFFPPESIPNRILRLLNRFQIEYETYFDLLLHIDLQDMSGPCV